MLKVYAFFAYFTSAVSILLSIIVYLKNKKSQKNILFSLWTLSGAIWSFGLASHAIATSKAMAVVWDRLLHGAACFIPVFFFHFVLVILDRLKNYKKVLFWTYVLTFFSLSFINTRLFISDELPKSYFSYFPEPGIIYYVFSLIFVFCVACGCYLLIKELTHSVGLIKNQVKYLLLGAGLSFIGGSTTFPLVFNINIFPYGIFLIPPYSIIIAYAITRYRLMDINLVLTRAGIFIIVYFPVVFIPFWIAPKFIHTNFWWIPILLMGILATLGIFIYNSLRRQAEARILREEHHAHQLLMQGSSGMTQIRDLKKLLNLIVHFVPKIMKVKNASIFLLNSELTQYIQAAIRFKNDSVKVTAIDVNDYLIVYLKAKRTPLVYEELKSYTNDKQFPKSEILSQMKNLSAAVILPCFIEDALLGFLILDEKRSGRMYTPEDLNVLTTLTNQAALAFENAQFYARDRENQALLYQSATLADMGVMADSMGHQIKNHIQKMMAEAGGNAGILEELLKQGIDNEKAPELLKRQIDVLYRIEKQGEAGGRLIESISKFSRLPKAAFREITLKEILDTANDILRFKVKFDEIDYTIDIPESLPCLYAHPILSEAFVNLIDNAYDAIREKEQELELEAKKTGQSISYRGSISFIAAQKNNSIEIQVKDNGIGIRKENIVHLFLPFYTTKATSAKGTGLGLFVIKKIVSNHKGAIKIDSEYMQGTTFTITIPIRQEK